MASRYSSYITTTTNSSSFDVRSSTKSDPASSIESLHNYSKAIIKSDKKSSILPTTKGKTSNLGSMMKKLIETKSNSGVSSKNRATHDAKKLYLPADFIAEDLKKNGVNKVGSFGNIQKKLLKGKKERGEGVGKKMHEISVPTKLSF